MDRFLRQAKLYSRFIDDWKVEGFFNRLSKALNRYIEEAHRAETKANRRKIAAQAINFFHETQKMTLENMKMPYSPVQIPRALMPQVGKHFNEFLNYLKDNGVSVRYDDVLPHTLKSSQSDFNPEAVESLMKRKPDLKPLFVSGDNHIMDGHHRWLARLHDPEQAQKPVRIMRTNNNIMDLIAMARRFPKTEFRNVTDIIKEAHKHAKKTGPIDEMMTLNRHPLVTSIKKLSNRNDESWMNQGDAITAAVGHGKRYLGSGVYGAAFAHKDHVIKVYRRDQAYEDFTDFVKQHPDDPHLPKIYKHKTIDPSYNLGVVKMERLEPLNKEDRSDHYQLLHSGNDMHRVYMWPHNSILKNEKLTDFGN